MNQFIASPDNYPLESRHHSSEDFYFRGAKLLPSKRPLKLNFKCSPKNQIVGNTFDRIT